ARHTDRRHKPALNLSFQGQTARLGGSRRAVHPTLRSVTGLDPRVHPLRKKLLRTGWIAGSSPAMTTAAMGFRAHAYRRAPERQRVSFQNPESGPRRSAAD